MKSEDEKLYEQMLGMPLISSSREARERFNRDLDQRIDPIFAMHGRFSWN